MLPLTVHVSNNHYFGIYNYFLDVETKMKPSERFKEAFPGRQLSDYFYRVLELCQLILKKNCVIENEIKISMENPTETRLLNKSLQCAIFIFGLSEDCMLRKTKYKKDLKHFFLLTYILLYLPLQHQCSSCEKLFKVKISLSAFLVLSISAI